MKFEDTPAVHDGSFSEAQRLAVLAEYDIARIRHDPALTAITDFVAHLCDAPISLVTLVEESRQWFPGRHGIDIAEMPREDSLCAQAMMTGGLMLVPDTHADARFRDNPLVTGAPFIRFYAGMSLIAAEGVPLGALCVVDNRPRDGLTAVQTEGLKLMASHVMARLTLLRAEQEQRRSEHDIRAELRHHEDRFGILADTMPQMVWSALPDGYHDYYNARWYEFTGMLPGSTDGEAWNGMFHPEDQDTAWERWRRSLSTGDPYEIEYRLRSANGDYRWVLGRALPMRNEQGEVIRWFGTCTDIHDQKMLLEQREIVSHELSHRIKNIFSVIGGLISFTARERPEYGRAAVDLRDRVMALGRAHDFVRPHSEASRPTRQQTSLHGLIEELLIPYGKSGRDHLRLSGDDVEIDDRSATPLALVLHELATNAAKYGGLSVEGGWIELVTRHAESFVTIEWREHGGPPAMEPDSEGFGTRLIELSAVRQLGGSIERKWVAGGLELRIRIPESSMNRLPR